MAGPRSARLADSLDNCQVDFACLNFGAGAEVEIVAASGALTLATPSAGAASAKPLATATAACARELPDGTTSRLPQVLKVVSSDELRELSATLSIQVPIQVPLIQYPN